ncbi:MULTISPECIES: ABC transporter ATP-binding protein [Bacteroides]|jgi:ATP-binding cassette subfamily B protein IrtA|uniref:ABC transporter ATP-binding protein n=1 Tax=Bacteroides TaxID=816 RepID=UPI0011802B86|nr:MULTISPECIES: ABC transporter ATP-binding protein [Bacteroides]MBV3833419.1 ABC transporter ATP-binding protein/permease [Bacteroides xylanisolvens]MBV3876437.1 ABC transporter ATP-binding protein/permease [Bacteroides xylanisolvens]MBV3881718.1 ABC transporter ATP-binding protein/permease [Bacteroides xylanisolvens]MBV3907841.1 ABC transporter ATP-binding protein/permease [Bacteroides xylanisolvens]MBV3913317.1 ABC transporter ATP-binding protein/permease [Bacteroides xylanisolvens]
MSTLKKLQNYMGKRKVLLPAAMLLSALSALAGMLPYILIWLIVRELLEHGEITSSGNVVTYAWWAAGMAVASIVLYFAALMSSHLAAFRVESNLRKEAMRQIVRMPLGFFDINTSGRIRKIIDDNAGVTHSFLAHQLPDLAATFLVPLVAAILIFVFDWILGLACIVPVIIAMLVMGFMMNAEGRQFMKSYMTSLEEMNTEAVEYVRGIPVVKVFQQTIYSFKNFHRCIMNYNKMVFGYTRMWEKPMSLYTVIINGFVFFLAPLAILLIGYSGNYASVLLNFFLFVLITPVFSQSIMKSMYLNQALGQASEAIGRLENLVAYEHLTVVEHPQPVKEFSIQFEKVSFSYPGANQKAVDDVSFTIPQGNTVALVGASGGGKTTIARLVPRFWEATEGKVLIGGINVREIAPEELMKYISFVFQNTKLFKTSLLENIKYGNPDATMEEVERAVDMAQCREIINKLPLGLNTKIGTEGTYLSGGEQQRIVLARAILKNAPIIVLDEATAFADPENEHLIQQALKELTKGKTVLMIAHRLSSITDADNILVIDKGKIAEQGTHANLLGKQGIYYRMWNEYQQSVRWTIGKEVSND